MTAWSTTAWIERCYKKAEVDVRQQELLRKQNVGAGRAGVAQLRNKDASWWQINQMMSERATTVATATQRSSNKIWRRRNIATKMIERNHNVWHYEWCNITTRNWMWIWMQLHFEFEQWQSLFGNGKLKIDANESPLQQHAINNNPTAKEQHQQVKHWRLGQRQWSMHKFKDVKAMRQQQKTITMSNNNNAMNRKCGQCKESNEQNRSIRNMSWCDADNDASNKKKKR